MTSTPRWMRWASVPFMLFAGGMLALQARINGELADQLGDGLRAGAIAALWSFGSAFVVLTAFVFSRPALRGGLVQVVHAVRERRLRPIELFGGLGGALFVASQGITVGTIGVALFIVAFTAGQSASSLAVDHFGLSPHGAQRIALGRVGAALLAVVAVVVAAGERLASDASLVIAGCALLAFVAGTLQAVQQALNGRVAAVSHSWAATWNNFAVGTSGLALFALASLMFDGQIGAWPSAWWMYMGGACGVVFVWVASWAVRTHGVLVLGLCMIAGQVATATALDLLGADAKVGVLGITASILTLIGVGLALWSGRQRA